MAEQSGFQSCIEALLYAAGLENAYAIEIMPSGRDTVVRMSDGCRFETASGIAEIFQDIGDIRGLVASGAIAPNYLDGLRELLWDCGADDLADQLG